MSVCIWNQSLPGVLSPSKLFERIPSFLSHVRCLPSSVFHRRIATRVPTSRIKEASLACFWCGGVMRRSSLTDHGVEVRSPTSPWTSWG